MSFLSSQLPLTITGCTKHQSATREELPACQARGQLVGKTATWFPLGLMQNTRLGGVHPKAPRLKTGTPHRASRHLISPRTLYGESRKSQARAGQEQKVTAGVCFRQGGCSRVAGVRTHRTVDLQVLLIADKWPSVCGSRKLHPASMR